MRNGSNSHNASRFHLPDSLEELIRILRTLPTGDAEADMEADTLRGIAASELGKRGDPMAVPALLEALADSIYVCTCSALALGKIKHPGAIDALVAVLSDGNKDWIPRGAAAVALGDFGTAADSALPALKKALKYSCSATGETWDRRARDAVKDAIRRITDPAASSTLRGKGFRYEMWGIY